MPLMSLLLPLVAQVGPASALPSTANPYASSLPIEIIEKKDAEAARRAREAQVVRLPTSGAGGGANGGAGSGCMNAVEANPQRSAELAQAALGNAIGRELVRAGLCLGAALSALDRWDEARSAFVAARDAADVADHSSRARLGAMAGNAALASGQPGQAIALLGPAATEAKIIGDAELTASIALDRARALVGVKQTGEAAAALAEREVLAGDDPDAAKLPAEHLFDPVCRFHRGHGAVEVEQQHGVGAGRLEQVLPLVQRGQAEGGRVWLEQADGMGIERRDDGGPAEFAGPADGRAHHGLVALVEPVEVAERQNGAAHRFGNGFAVVETNHVRSGL